MTGNPAPMRHLRAARRYPLLSMETEIELVRRWREDGDRTALEHLIGSYQRLVVKIAGAAGEEGAALADPVAAGNIGLLQAIDTFDADQGVRLSTYAMWWVRAAIRASSMRLPPLAGALDDESPCTWFHERCSMGQPRRAANDHAADLEARSPNVRG